MGKRTLGAILIAVGVSAWGVYAVLAYVADLALSPMPFLAWHLAGVVPGSYLCGSPLIMQAIRALMRRFAR